MQVFWSWQNDHAPKSCRNFIRAALAEATEKAGDELGLEDAERPELDHDTKNEPGMAEISATILAKISRSAVFVADLTPVGKTGDGKALPNPNVLIELGWALRELTPERIIAVLNTADGCTPGDLPFDIRHRQVLTYELADGADAATREAVEKTLVKDLTAALRTNLDQYLESQATSEMIEGVPANHDDPSIWASAGPQLKHPDSFGRQTTITMPKCARGYIRIIPGVWRANPPAVNEIEEAFQDVAVCAPTYGFDSGSHGPCEEGFVRYWYTGKDADGQHETTNVSMYFDETGEFWILHGTAIVKHKGKLSLGLESLVKGWARALTQAFTAFERFGASPVRKVEAGLVGMSGVRWPGKGEYDSPPARKDQCVVQRQHRDWGEEAQLDFLTDAYNRVRDLYSIPRASVADTSRLIGLM